MKIWTLTEGYFKDERPGTGMEVDDISWLTLRTGQVSYILDPDGSRKIYLDGKETEAPDLFTILDYSKATFPLARHLEAMGSINLTGSEAIRICSSKMDSYEKMVEEGVPCPKTIAIYAGMSADILLEELSLPFIMKPDAGFGGKDVLLIHSKEEAEKELADISVEAPLMLAQKFVATSRGKDLRVITIGDQAVIGVLRKAENKNEFRSNVALGGKAEKYELDDKTKALAVSAAKAVGLGFSGVDLLFTEEGFVIGEINPSPGINDKFIVNTMLPTMKEYVEKVRRTNNL